MPYEIVGHCEKAQSDAGGGSLGLRPNVSEAAGGEERVHGIAQSRAGKRLAKFERSGRQEMGGVLGGDSGQLDLRHGYAEIVRDRT